MNSVLSWAMSGFVGAQADIDKAAEVARGGRGREVRQERVVGSTQGLATAGIRVAAREA